MKKKREKPLQLNRETLRNLHLHRVRGREVVESEQSNCGIPVPPQWLCAPELPV